MTAKAKSKKAETKAEPIVSYKGFDKDFRCRGFQFEVGKTYKVEGNIVACENGFHACENPFDVWSYYPVVSDDGSFSRYAVVEQGGKTDRHSGDSKIASAEITIKAEIALPDFIRKCVSWVIDNTKGASDEPTQAASGDYSRLAASGDSSQLAASGYSSQLAASGDYSQLAASGDYSRLAASGDSSQLAASGYSSQLAASGDYSQLAASGDYSRLAASGYSSQLAASGDYSRLAASGDSSQLAASGYSSQLAASGDSSQLAASGDYSQLAASGKDSVIAASAPGVIVSGAEGTHISLADFDHNGKCVGFVTGCIGKDGLKPNTWYRAKGGKFVEVEQ
jgi:alkylhydroperoxidase family enzyme